MTRYEITFNGTLYVREAAHLGLALDALSDELGVADFYLTAFSAATNRAVVQDTEPVEVDEDDQW